jgi:hypothetical protein
MLEIGRRPGSDNEARSRRGDYFAEVLLLDQGAQATRARVELGWKGPIPHLSRSSAMAATRK